MVRFAVGRSVTFEDIMRMLLRAFHIGYYPTAILAISSRKGSGMTSDTDWKEAERRTERALGSYPHANFGLSAGLALAGYGISTLVLAFTNRGDNSIATLLIGGVLGASPSYSHRA